MMAGKHEILSKAEALSETESGLFLGYKFACVKEMFDTEGVWGKDGGNFIALRGGLRGCVHVCSF